MPRPFAAAQRFERLIKLLLDTVPQDATMRRVGAALSSTTRQVNTLQQRVAPGLERRLQEIAETLLERERDEDVRLRHLVRHRRASPHGPSTVGETAAMDLISEFSHLRPVHETM